MRFSVFQDSQPGSRAVNQDRMGYSFTRDSLLLVVADGMGGHLRGEVAAQIALQTIAARFQREARPLLVDPRRFLGESIIDAHVNLLQYTRRERLPDCPRTTVVACVLQQGKAWWVHAGDSRLYWLRHGEVVTRTRDHSKVEGLVQAGIITAADAERHPERNKVHTCLGAPVTPRFALSDPQPLQPGDVLMLCSDGLWSNLPENILAGQLTRRPLTESVPQLVAHAVQTGGATCDNVTMLAVSWLGDDLPVATSAPVATVAAADEEPWSTTIPVLSAALEQPDSVRPTPGARAGGGRKEGVDDEVDAAIAEIQDAIARSNASLTASLAQEPAAAMPIAAAGTLSPNSPPAAG